MSAGPKPKICCAETTSRKEIRCITMRDNHHVVLDDSLLKMLQMRCGYGLKSDANKR